MTIKNNSINFSINIGDLILILTLIYSVVFNGGAKNILPLANTLTTFSLLLFTAFQIFSPAIIAYILYDIYSDKIYDISISYNSIIITFIVTIYLITTNLSNINLFSDEIAYAQNSFRIGSFFLDKIIIVFPLLGLLPSNYLLQFVTLIQWVIVFSLFYCFQNYNNKNKINFFFIFLIIFRLSYNLIGIGSTGPHPPLLYFFPSIFSSIFGISGISIKLSNCFASLIFFIYLFNRLDVSFFYKIMLILMVSFVPIIGYHSLNYDQTIFSFICFSVIIIETLLFSPKPNSLFLFISIMCLFRQTCIAAIIPVIIYSMYYYYEKNSLKRMVFKIINSAFPLILFFPFFIISLIMGTPSTPKIQDGIDIYNIFNRLMNLDLIYNAYNVLELYIIFPVLIILYLIIKNRIKDLVIISSLGLSYLAMHLVTEPNFASKYYFELYGFGILVSLVIFIYYLFNTSIINSSNKIFIISGLLLFIHFYSFYYTHKKNKKYDHRISIFKLTKDFNPIVNYDNHLDYCIDYLKSNDLIDQSYIAGIDYGIFPLILNGCTYNDVNSYKKLRSKYYKNKNIALRWLDLDLNAINNIEGINYLVISDNILERDNKVIETLHKSNIWKNVFNLPKSQSYHSLKLYKRKH